MTAPAESTRKLTVISLGAGVQSTTLALMAARGDIGPMPDCAIFADTGWEPAAVYKHLDWLETQLPFPVRRISGGNIVDHILRNSNKSGQRFASVPWCSAGATFNACDVSLMSGRERLLNTGV